MTDKKMSVKGLANIGQLLNRADMPITPIPTVKRKRRDHAQIHERTMEKVGAALAHLPGTTATQINLIENYVRAGLRDAYNCGHADALDQNSAVEALLEKQFEARTKLTMPTVAAAVMEQLGLRSMTLDLAYVATVFERNRIEFAASEQDVIEYLLIPIDDEV